jgi:hypothetical protein
MQNAATVLDVTRKRGNSPRQGMITGEPGAGKLARRDREGADGKGPWVPRRLPTSLGKGPTEKDSNWSTSLVAYFTR